MNKSKYSPAEIKKIERESWKGPQNHEYQPTQNRSQKYTKKWDAYLIERSFCNIDLKNKKIINFGGGHGKEAENLLENGAACVTLIDIAEGQLKSALLRKKQHNLDNLELFIGDAEKLCFKDKSFDIGFIKAALHHFPNHEKAISEIIRVSNTIVFIDIMECSLTKYLNKIGLYKEEWNGIEPNRLNSKIIKKIFEKNNREISIQYFFVPPYYGKSIILLIFIDSVSKMINFGLPKSNILSNFFGNVAIISG